MKQYGVGVVLYFTFMRFLSRAFLALSVLSIPTILLHVAGDHYEPKEDPVAEIIERSSLGNYGELYRWEMGGLLVGVYLCVVHISIYLRLHPQVVYLHIHG